MKDLFSEQSIDYQSFRPRYPKGWYESWMDLVSGRNIAWDCATGNGQTAIDLANYFDKVLATDISQEQLSHAFPSTKIQYSIGSAEQNSFPDNCFDLITVSQAAHWFDLPAFYTEVNRVLKPGGILAIWGYHLPRFNQAIDSLVDLLYKDILRPYWDEARKLIDSHYQDLYFPFSEIIIPEYAIEMQFSRDQLTGYLSTWSALKAYCKANGTDPLPEISKRLEMLWRADEIKTGRFPIFSKFAQMPS